MPRWRWLISVAVLLGMVYWAWPFLGAAEIVRAARSGDSAILLDRVNLPALRRSLARQIAQAYLKATGKADKMGALGRSVAGAAATTIADPYLAELLTPDNLVALLGQGRINSVKIGDKDLAVDRDLPGFLQPVQRQPTVAGHGVLLRRP